MFLNFLRGFTMNTMSTEIFSENSIVPNCAWITVNRACNLRCEGCYAKSIGYGNELNIDFSLAEKIIQIVISLGIKSITVLGGEPTVWNRLIDFNKLCKENGLKSTIVTNAMRFGNDNFWAKYIESPNTRAGISVKAFDKESLKTVTGVSSFKLAEKGLKRGLEYFKCGVSTVYSKTSSQNILDMAKFSMDCGAKSFSLSPCTPSFCEGVPDGSSMTDPVSMVNHIIDIYPKLVEITGGKISFSMKLPLCLWPKDFIDHLAEQDQITTVCQVQQKAGVIFDVNGQVALCNSLFDFPVGKYGVDFSDEKSLVSLMNSQKTIEMYDKLTAYPSSKCISCPRWNVCAGGCPLYWTYLDPEKVIPGVT